MRRATRAPLRSIASRCASLSAGTPGSEAEYALVVAGTSVKVYLRSQGAWSEIKPGVFRIATEIVFAKDEVVEHVALGDTVSWEVAPAANSLFIKPRERAGRTNLEELVRVLPYSVLRQLHLSAI